MHTYGHDEHCHHDHSHGHTHGMRREGNKKSLSIALVITFGIMIVRRKFYLKPSRCWKNNLELGI